MCHNAGFRPSKSLLHSKPWVRRNARGDYEIILISPFEPPVGHKNIVWVYEDPATANGCNAGHAKAREHFTGDFVIPWVDDHLISDGWDLRVIKEYEAREKLFHKQSPGKPFCMGLRHTWPFHVGTQFGIYYPYFPFQRRQYLDVVGWFDPAYQKGFADGDLAMRIWQAGGRCEWTPNAMIVVHPDDCRKAGVVFAQADMDLFVQRWAPVYGQGWNTGHIRDFNMDIVPEDHPNLVGDRTVFHTDPSYRNKALANGWQQ